MQGAFVPAGFKIPEVFTGSAFHLEPLGEQHNDRDHVAWMSSIEHIRSSPGFDSPESTWPEAMSLERNLEDLVGHARDFDERKGFTYSILDGDEVIGCVYIYPGNRPGHDAEISSWVRESRAEMDPIVWNTLSTWIDVAWAVLESELRPKRLTQHLRSTHSCRIGGAIISRA